MVNLESGVICYLCLAQIGLYWLKLLWDLYVTCVDRNLRNVYVTCIDSTSIHLSIATQKKKTDKEKLLIMKLILTSIDSAVAKASALSSTWVHLVATLKAETLDEAYIDTIFQ